MNQQCTQCSKTFQITKDDQAFYEKIDVPHPTMCPDCRRQLRLSFRNESTWYHDKCALCEKGMISMYAPDSPYTVYCQDCWWSDKWDPLDFGRDYDSTQSFFEQFKELMMQAPRIAIINTNSENSEYTNISADNKNCYVLVETSNNEDSMYSYWIQRCRNVEYYFLNKFFSKEEYEKVIANINPEEFNKKFNELILKHPRKFQEVNKSEDCTGNYIERSKECKECYHAESAEQCTYSVDVWRNAKNCMDVDTAGRNVELIYESINTAIDSYNCKFCMLCWTVQDGEYLDNCHSSSNCFGSIGLKNNKYVILNKQYSESEYNELVHKIKQNEDYGKFFPVELTPYAYNETVAQREYNLDKVSAEKLGYRWKEKLPFPSGNKDEPKDVYSCAQCERNFKLVDQEKDFYKKMDLNFPTLCPQCRLSSRLEARNLTYLWHRQCMCTQPNHKHSGRCLEEFETTYNPDRPEIVYCKTCYDKSIY